MGTNPMQKIKKVSTITGILIGLSIGLALCVGLYFFLTSETGKNMTESGKEETIAVQVLTKTVKAGGKITVSDVTTKVMNKSEVPSNATSINKDVITKIDLAAGTILTTGMLNASSETITKDLREQEYNMIVLPSNLSAEDFIDIRIQLPNGGDYIVISKKQVKKCNETTVWLNMNEEEIEVLSNAIIEYYIMTGSKLYATIYTDPGLQEASKPTYCPNSTVHDLLINNPNINVNDDEGRLVKELKNLRNNNISTAVNQYSENALENIETKLQEEIKSLKEARESYFGTLNSVQ